MTVGNANLLVFCPLNVGCSATGPLVREVQRGGQQPVDHRKLKVHRHLYESTRARQKATWILRANVRSGESTRLICLIRLRNGLPSDTSGIRILAGEPEDCADGAVVDGPCGCDRKVADVTLRKHVARTAAAAGIAV